MTSTSIDGAGAPSRHVRGGGDAAVRAGRTLGLRAVTAGGTDWPALGEARAAGHCEIAALLVGAGAAEGLATAPDRCQ
jgi:hypothetical protein